MFTRLRLSTALAHQFNGATLTMRRTDGATVTAGAHPSSDIGVYDFRRTLICSPCSLRAEMAHRVVDVDLGGALLPMRGDLYWAAVGDQLVRTFATELHPNTVIAVLETLDCEPPCDVEARLGPDPGLGVTTVTIRRIAPGSRPDHLDDLAVLAYDACVIEELVRSTC